MKTDTVEISPMVGGTSIFSPKLSKRKILVVERSGANYNIIRGIIPSPGTREADYISFLGAIRFDVPFNAGEIIKVWYVI